MMKCLYLLYVVFHVAAGCDLSGDETEITRHKGGSVLLPCSCSDLHTKPQTFTWMIYRTGRLTDMLNDEHYRDRLQLFNKSSPGNLSLLISDLREEDQGDYRCSTEKEHRDVKIYVKGCELVKEAGVESITVFTGESVVLPCVCTDLQDKPKSLKWDFSISTKSGSNRYQEIYPAQTGHHRNRVKLVSKSSPGNLSLLVSDLTEQDQGIYTCSVQEERKYFRLYVKVGRRETSTRSGKTDRRQPSKKTTQGQGTCEENVNPEGRPDCKGKSTDQVSKRKMSYNRSVSTFGAFVVFVIHCR
ncbi:junctional adhesion molecule-like [Tachysurus fulvidraco]|uniref:junctional adhesion molecule-like n=1 Tax=Tachysurus fulvidraco TaxID=1234273 RepID=UPI001FEDF64F|nr:junctional adhesion molecule-like [Tachysurus fulvidraco]